MCPHQTVTIVPTEETSWGIADSHLIKCTSCGMILYEADTEAAALKYICNHKLHYLCRKDFDSI